MRGTRIRWPILSVAIAGVALTAALLGWYFLIERPVGGVSLQGTRTNVLLIGCAESEDGQRAREFAVVSLTGEGPVVFLIVPDALSVKLADGTLDELGNVYGRRGAEGTCEVVEALLGVDLDSYVAWHEDGFVRLVDEVGGVALTLNEGVVYAADTDEAQIEIRQGEQVLGGLEALAYARGESSDPRLARQQRLLYGLLEQGFVGSETRSVKATIRAVQPFLETDMSLSELFDLGVAFSGVEMAALRTTVVPTDEVNIDGVRALQPRVVETERLVATLIRGLELLTPNEVEVAVFNGNGVRLMASRVADYLRARGFEVTRVANAESFAYPTSYIVVLTDESKAWILRDALPSGVSIVFPDAFEEHYNALAGLVPFGTDLLFIVGAGMEFE
jgi:LCP family protein required for cell wall assembly